MRGIVFGFAAGDFCRAGRTERALARAGIMLDGGPLLTREALAARLEQVNAPRLLVRAGAWFCLGKPIPDIVPSATGRPLVAFGAIRDTRGPARFEHPAADAWAKFLGSCGGDFDRRSLFRRTLPEAACVYVEPPSARELALLLRSGSTWLEALQRLVRERRFRAVHLPELDVHDDPAWRVLQLVTTIQIGGAERVALDLAAELTSQHARVCIAALGGPTRSSFPEPANFADLSHVPNEPEARALAVAEVCHEFAADLVHAHLIRGGEARAIKELGVPFVMTVHNMPPSWPAGLEECDPSKADLLLACSQAVEAAVSASNVGVPVRTLWNGIDPKPFEPTPVLGAAGAAVRHALGWAANDFVVAAIANPRAQKRLERLPEIVQVLQRILGPGRAVRLLLAGEPSHGSKEARDAVHALESELDHRGVREQVRSAGAVRDVAPLLAASDALVSVSAFEGLSLVHLEALAAGLPVVATDGGGTREIARQSGSVHLLPADADAAAFARVLRQIAACSSPREAALPRSFTRWRMAARALSLYPRAIERSRCAAKRDGLWLITNNFSTGGAQLSARRLLLGLKEQGVKVRATVIEEQPAHPTPGRKALLGAGIHVSAVAPPQNRDAAEAVGRILAELGTDPPRAVIFWNLITSYKVLIADAVLDAAVYDVSPGAMYFDGLAKYFARPRPGEPYLEPREYGARLTGLVVKYEAEAAPARDLLGASVRVIRNGVPVSGELRARRHRSPLMIGTAARLSPDKRLEDLVEAVRLAHPHLPRYTLRVAGGVERGAEAYARELRRLARGLPVQWCGELIGIEPFLADLDLFVMISEPAGCPNASLEAMAAGVPVIATEVGGAAEQIIDRATGRLVQRGDALAFANAMVELAHDHALRAQLGGNAREHIRAQFSLEQMIESYRALLGLL